MSNQGSNGVSFAGFLTLLFIGLKLAGFIDWSWFWILSPIWIPFAIGVTIATTIAIVASFGKRK